MSEVILSFFKNLTFFFFYKENTPRSRGKRGFLDFGTLQFRVGKSETKTLDFTSGEYLEVSMVKISAQLDKVRGGS